MSEPPTETPTSTPVSDEPRWIKNDKPSPFCNEDCSPYLAIANYVCAIGSGKSLKIVSNSRCSSAEVPCPGKTFSCTKKPCSSWKMVRTLSKCNVTCGHGFRKELYQCQSNGSTVPDNQCLRALRPAAFQRCFSGPCGNVTWLFSRWSRCVGFTCYGMKYRKAICQDSAGNGIPFDVCLKYLLTPNLRKTCTKPKCENEYFWYRGEWSKCSAECGTGLQIRHVVCLRRIGNNKVVVGSQCDYRYKPTTSRKCEVKKGICPRWMSSPVWHTPKGRTKDEDCISTRRVRCVNGTRIVSPKLCPPLKRPISQRPCESVTRTRYKYKYTEADPNIRLSDGEIIKTDLYWTCPPVATMAQHENYVWMKVQGQKRTNCKRITKRHFSVMYKDDRLVMVFEAGAPISKELTGHYVCIGYNDSQNVWDGDYHHRTVSYYKTKIVRMTPQMKVHQAKAGEIVRLVCQMNDVDDEDIVWLRNGVKLKVRGGEHKEFMKSMGKVRFICQDSRSGKKLTTLIRVDPMTPISCTFQPYGCCAEGYVPATTQLQKKCSARSVIPCKRSRFGCCPKQNVAAIGKQHLGCKYRYIHPSRCDKDSQTLFSAMKKCSKPLSKSIGQLRYHLDVTTKRCAPFTLNVDCSHVKDVPLFATADDCRKQCINVNQTERCKIHSVSVTKDEKCPSREDVWYYDIWSKECVNKHSISVCLMNANRFTSQTACNRECKYPRYTRNAENECLQPKAEVTCRNFYGYDHQYYYDYSVGQCRRFKYYGCHGTSNRFTSLQKCKEKCDGEATPEVLKDICSLPRDLGYCPLSPEHVRRWYHDPKDGICKEMMYTQCGGNANNFETQMQCTKACGANIDIDVCELDHDKGDCLPSRNFRRYYFDKNSRRCRRFSYTGCGGNPNNFISLRQCNKACLERTTVAPTLPPITPREPKTENRPLDYEPCRMPQSVGNCPSTKSTVKSTGRLSRWYYDVHNRRCRSFLYAGCQGNANLFDTRNLCEFKCEDRLGSVPGKCRRRVKRRCLGDTDGISVYVYDVAMGQCVNKRLKNKCKRYTRKYFTTIEDCKSECRAPPPTDDDVTDKCFVTPQTFDQCPDYQRVQRWYFNVEEQTCMQYDTCPYSKYLGNSHVSQEECQRQCMSTYIRDICSMPKDVGKCSTNRAEEMFYYNLRSRKCERFFYNGCLGNKNRFTSAGECRAICEDEMKDANPVTEVAFQPNNSLGKKRPEYQHYRKTFMEVCNVKFSNAHYGTCAGDGYFLERWYYANGKCSRFHYNGCGAPLNFFDSRFSCEKSCLKKRPEDPTNALAVQSICHVPAFSGECRRTTRRWFSDPKTRECKPFKGCSGIPNSFPDKKTCQKTCYASDKLDICRLPKDPGPCLMPLMRWYYDNTVRKCRKFIYSGCHGNANRFVNQIECENSCHRTDPCRLPLDRGEHHSDKWHRRYFFNVTSGKCDHFWFSGSGGNANQFKSLQECSETCEVPVPRDEPVANRDRTFTCNQPREDIPCANSSTDNQLFAHYDKNLRKCQLKSYKVCGEVSISGNRFPTLESCQELCETKIEAMEDPRKCQSPIPKKQQFCRKWDSQWYFDNKTKECKFFWYGFCEMDKLANRFLTRESCEETCIEPFLPTIMPQVTIHVHVEDRTPSPSDLSITEVCPPIPAPDLRGECRKECTNDDDCEGNKMCCSVTDESCPLFSVCLEPVTLPQAPIKKNPCHFTRHGCCPDGSTEAKDRYLNNCPPQEPKLLSRRRVMVRSIAQSQMLILKCDISAAPKAEIDWYRNKKKIDFGTGVYVQRFIKKDFELVISPVQPIDDAIWSCNATNRHGSVTKEFSVHIDVAATLTRMSPELLRIEENSSVRLECLARGIPTPLVNWYFKGEHNKNFKLLSHGPMTYLVRRVNSTTAGQYRCEADNGVKLSDNSGAVFNNYTMTLQVLIPMEAAIIAYPYSKRVQEGSPMRLRCNIISGPPHTSVKWVRNGRDVGSVLSSDGLSSEFRIRKTKLSDSGDYECILKNIYADSRRFPVHIDIYRDSSLLPNVCQDRIGDCKVKIEMYGHSKTKMCKNTFLAVKCCRTCYELGKLELNDIEFKK